MVSGTTNVTTGASLVVLLGIFEVVSAPVASVMDVFKGCTVVCMSTVESLPPVEELRVVSFASAGVVSSGGVIAVEFTELATKTDPPEGIRIVYSFTGP